MSVGLPCQPFGPTIQCTCDKRGQALRCLPVNGLARNVEEGSKGGNLWSRELMDISLEREDDIIVDQRTEVILAYTLLVITVLSFIL